MTDEKDSKGNLLPEVERMTKIGSFIRKTSVDEFPQLLNVIKGDMSLVGPRPLLVDYLPLYSTEQALRHNVRPGITGWAQVNGRNTISWEEKFKLDVWYVRNLSFLLDFKILLITLKKVFVSEGISSSDSVTMSKFKGNQMVIIGASGHAKVISNTLYLSGVNVSAYYDDCQLEFYNSIKVFCPINKISANDDAIIAIGNNSIRKRIESAHPTLNYAIAIHPKSVIDKSVSIGVGSVVMASATINNSTIIGKHCIINTSSSIDHDCKLENYVHISPGAVLCGGIQVSEGTFIGAGAIVIPNIKIGKWATIGAGSIIINDIPDYAVVVGNPGVIKKYNQK